VANRIADFSGAVMSLLGSGDKKVMIELSKVTYVDSATIGCLMDLYRQITAAGGELRLAGVNKRVETMLTMTGAHNFLKMFPDEAGALASFGIQLTPFQLSVWAIPTAICAFLIHSTRLLLLDRRLGRRQ